MSSPIRTRIEKLERQPRAAPSPTAVWEFESLLHVELRSIVKNGSPAERAVAQEIIAKSKTVLTTLSEVSSPALDLLKTLLVARGATSA